MPPTARTKARPRLPARVGAPLNTRRHPKAEPVPEPWRDPRLDEGIRLFNEGKHWHAHEAWEELWLGLEDDDKLFLQGLIMAAAMLHQYRRGVVRGVVNHYQNVFSRIEAHAPRKWGIDVAGLLEQLRPYAEPVIAGETAMPLDAGAVRIRRQEPS